MQLAAGGFHFLVLLENGDVYAWGNNHYGQVGDGTTKEQSTPTRVLRGVRKVAAGFNHSVAVMSDGELCTWGCNSNGQLGDGTTEHRALPGVVLHGKDPLFEVLEIAAGKEHTLAVIREPGRSRTQCYGWGGNVSGLEACSTPSHITTATLTGLAQNALRPVMVCEDVALVAAGMTHSIAIKSNGDCVAWGRNTNGQLGDGTTVNRLSAVKVMERVRTISAGVDYSLAVLESGELLAWGCNRGGRLGDGTTLDRAMPVRILNDVRSICAGHCHALAVTGDGDCLGWGRNLHHCVCSSGDPEVLRPILVRSQVAFAAAGGCHSIAVSSSGEFLVWGRDWHGQLSSLRAFDAAQAPASFERGPAREAFEAQEEAQRLLLAGASGAAALGNGDSVALAALLDAQLPDGGASPALSPASPRFAKYALGAALGDAGAEEEDELELPPPPGWRPPAEGEEVVKQEVVEEAPVEEVVEEAVPEEEPDWPELRSRWTHIPTAKHGKGFHLKMHMKARQAGRNYLQEWARFRRDAYAENDGKALSQEHEEHTLLQFHAQIVERACQFGKADSKVGGATLRGWTVEDCHPSTGVLALEKELAKAIKAIIGDTDMYGEPPPCPEPPSPKRGTSPERA
mmetsp:Transcript_131530/g.420769  ORF Transcript_131530/g.420769 Transcript_131530/m.420769 type:complete len:626 (-) Transcript_131530:587-2464(-)